MNQTSDTRSALLASARGLFARHGYDGASIRDITGQAHVNLGAITYHFGTKQELYEAVLESITTPLIVRLTKAADQAPSPLAGIEAVVRALFAHWTEHPDWPSLIAHELAHDRPLPAPARRTMQAVAGLVSGLVRDGQQQGLLVDGDPLLLTFSIVSQPMYLALVRRKLQEALRLDTESPEMRAEFVEHAVAFVHRSLLAPRRTA